MKHSYIDNDCPPIFILGVPRSGTTLLRMMIDSHPDIMCGPEAPWITNQVEGGWPSVSKLAHFLIDHKWGATNSLQGINEEVIHQLMAQLVDGIFKQSAQSHGKKIWAEKTPRNIIAVPFLYRLFPNAKFIHILRDGRDVALSTQAGKWKKIPYNNKKIKNSYKNALLRWVNWINTFEADTKHLDIPYYAVKYEDLVINPKEEMQKVLDFVEVSWNESVLDPYKTKHDVIDKSGEGIKSFGSRGKIDAKSTCRWKTQLNWCQTRATQKIAEDMLLRFGYEPTNNK